MAKAYPTKAVHSFTYKEYTFQNSTKKGFKKSKIKELKEHATHKAKVEKALQHIKTNMNPFGHAWIWTISYLRYKYIVSYVCSDDLDGIISKLQEKFPGDTFWYNLD